MIDSYIMDNYYIYGCAIGPRGNATIPVKYIYVNNTLTLYMIEDGTQFTKIVSNEGHERYYVGKISEFNFHNWNKYNNSGPNGYKLKKEGFCFYIKIKNDDKNKKELEDKEIEIEKIKLDLESKIKIIEDNNKEIERLKIELESKIKIIEDNNKEIERLKIEKEEMRKFYIES
jgi:hypothetical protein